MSNSLINDAFDHHVWATGRVLDACAGLSPDQLATAVPGTYGSILDTLRHTVGADAGYLNALTAGATPRIDDDQFDVAGLARANEANGVAWAALLAGHLDAAAVVVRHREDGSETHAPIGIRLAQALHHGTDHRSQVCTALTALGIEPPYIDVWMFGEQDGRVIEVPPTA